MYVLISVTELNFIVQVALYYLQKLIRHKRVNVIFNLFLIFLELDQETHS